MEFVNMTVLFSIAFILCLLPFSTCDPCTDCENEAIAADNLCMYSDFAVKIKILNETRYRPRCQSESLRYRYQFEVLEHYLQRAPWRFEAAVALGLETRFNMLTCGDRFTPGKTYILIADLEWNNRDTDVYLPYYNPCRNIRVDIESEPARAAEVMELINNMCSHGDCEHTWECKYQKFYS